MLLGDLNRQQHHKRKTWDGEDLSSVMCTDLYECFWTHSELNIFHRQNSGICQGLRAQEAPRKQKSQWNLVSLSTQNAVRFTGLPLGFCYLSSSVQLCIGHWINESFTMGLEPQGSRVESTWVNNCFLSKFKPLSFLRVNKMAGDWGPLTSHSHTLTTHSQPPAGTLCPTNIWGLVSLRCWPWNLEYCSSAAYVHRGDLND